MESDRFRAPVLSAALGISCRVSGTLHVPADLGLPGGNGLPRVAAI
jgi:hypothetical protein